jgi:Ca2+-transporting ATPase
MRITREQESPRPRRRALMDAATTPVDYSLIAPDALAGQLNVDSSTGLAPADASERLRDGGPNVLKVEPERPAWIHFLNQFQDALVYVLLIAGLITLAVWWLEGGAGWPVDALVIFCIVLINALIGVVQEARSRQAAAALSRLTAAASTVLRGGVPMRIPSAEIVVGDVLLLAEGDLIGADARLVQASTLRVQEASLTGESEAVLKHVETLARPVELGDRRNMVFRGTAVTQGTGRAVVTATGMRTEMGAIAHLLETTAEEATPLQKEIRAIGRTLGFAVLVVAIVVVATVLLISDISGAKDVTAALLLGVSLAVAAVPEGLPAILSLVLALGVQRMAARKAIVKKLSSVETLGSASVICSDKTGTLTRSEMTIERVLTSSGCACPSGVGYTPEGQFHHQGQPMGTGPLHSEVVVVLSGGSLASNADLRQDSDGTWVIQGDPTEVAFLVAERKLGAHARRSIRFERSAEIPFTSERKLMSVLVIDRENHDQRLIITKGAPDVLLDRCARVRVGNDVLPMTDDVRARALADVDALSSEALRTLSVAYRPLDAADAEDAGEALERDLIFVGTVGIIDPPRPEAAEAIKEAHQAGIRVIMITGDHPRTAARIAADLGIIAAGEPALTGADIDAMDAAALGEVVRTASVFARVAPAHKLRIVDALQAQGHIVAMTGDGVNDAPALKSADIGVAMGVTGSEVTKAAGKMILADDNFATIVAAVREGRGLLDNIRKFLRYLLSSNMGEVMTVFLGVVGARLIGLTDAGGAMVAPLLATQILWINLITDSGPALAMGVDDHGEDVMLRQPRRPDERIIDRAMWSGVIQIGLVMALTTLLTIDLFLPGGFLVGDQGLETARTAAFSVLVIAQLFNALNARSESASAFTGLFNNRWLWAAIIVGVLLQVAVVETPLLNHAFATVPLSAGQWAVCVAMASTVLWFSEMRKLGLRRSRRAAANTTNPDHV